MLCAYIPCTVTYSINTTLDETPQIEAKFQLTLPLNKINTSKTNSYIQLFPQIHVAGVNLDR